MLPLHACQKGFFGSEAFLEKSKTSSGKRASPVARRDQALDNRLIRMTKKF